MSGVHTCGAERDLGPKRLLQRNFIATIDESLGITAQSLVGVPCQALTCP